jgi:hypothetical protein
MYLATDPRFDPLREDTRFRSFLQKLGLPLIAYPAPIPSRAGTVWNRSYWRISAEAVQTYLEHYVANRCSETLSNFGL